MIRCIRLWTGSDGNSHFEEGTIALKPGPRTDQISEAFPITKSFFQETPAGGVLDWHTAPARQFVVTLSGTLNFQTRGGGSFQLTSGKILLAEDTTGTGHSWKLIGPDPWRRLYLVLEKGAVIPFFKG